MRIHWPTVRGRVRSDPGLLLLVVLVVALTTALTGAVAPLSERTADDAIAATVRDAGPRGAVVATAPREDEDPRGQARQPRTAVELAQDATYAESLLPPELGSVVQPGVATYTSTALQLMDEGPGRYLRLAYVDQPSGPPEVEWTAGTAPAASVGADEAEVEVPSSAPPWPVQVGVSESVAAALGLEPGDRLPAEDEQHRPVAIVVSGVYAAADPGAAAWRAVPELLDPVRGTTQGTPRTSGAALVSPESLPDLRLAVPLDDLRQQITFDPRPDRLRYDATGALGRAVASLQTSSGAFAWDSLLGGVLDRGRSEVAGARGQAAVLLIGLLAATLLLLVLAAQLLVRRRSRSIDSTRERGATLPAIGAELLVESVGVAVLGAAAGLATVGLLVGDVGWLWVLPVLLVAALAAPVLGVVAAASVTDVRRTPANRSARRAAAQARRARRWLVELAVLAAAVLSLVALRQRGAATDGRTDLTAAGAPTWWALAGAVVVLRLFPLVVRRALVLWRRSEGGTGFFVLARLAEGGGLALPLLLLTVAVSQVTLGATLATTERAGQQAGALQAVGGDARLTTGPDPALSELARGLEARPGVRVAVAGRVADGVRASSPRAAATVRLVVVDAAGYERLLAASPLPDVPALGRLRPASGAVPALLVGGDPGLREGLQVRFEDADPVPLEVVGTAPRVDASADPVVVVDAAAFAATGVGAAPNTVWAVGPGAGTALRAAAGAGTVTLLSEAEAARRDAPLPSALLRLAVAAAMLLLVLALLGIALGAALGAPARAGSLGRLRALGLGTTALRRVLAWELLLPVAAATVAGLALGVTAALVTAGPLDLELVTGQADSPALRVPWWVVVVACAPLVGAAVVARAEAGRVRRTPLARLLRAGEDR